VTKREPAADQIGVFLLDDHEIVRRGVRELLEADPGIAVVGEAGTAESALARIPALRPDVAVLDVRLPDGDGITVCRDIRSRMPDVACLMLTSFGDDQAIFDAIMAGAAGYVLKQIRGSDLVGAVRTVASGESMLDPEAATRVMKHMRDEAARTDPLAALTSQERRILELIGEGLTNRQIGERMYLAEKTVKNYVSALFAKMGMERRTQAAAYAARAFAREENRDQNLRTVATPGGSATGGPGRGGPAAVRHQNTGVILARVSTRRRTNSAGSGHGKRPDSEVRRLTVPCRATHTAVASATTSRLADAPAVTHASIASTSSANAWAPTASSGGPPRPGGTGGAGEAG
jgi:DNA-binding NarL/FixJ family response regulator